MLKLNAKQIAVVTGGVSGLVVLLIIGVVYGARIRQGVVTNQLSDRSKEFLDSHAGSLAETAVDFGDGKAFTENLAVDGACFSLVVPFASKLSPADDGAAQSCTVRLVTQQPTSRLVISSRPFDGKLADDPAIQLRRQTSFGFKESSISATKYPTVVRFDDKETVSIFWLTAGKMMTIAFTGLADTTKVDTDRLVVLIQSIILNTKPTQVKNYDATPSASASSSAGL